MGGAVVSLGQSQWLLAFSQSFVFSLALSKRHVELMRARQDGETVVSERGYRSDDRPLTLVFGIGAGLTSILIMLLYMTNVQLRPVSAAISPRPTSYRRPFSTTIRSCSRCVIPSVGH
jgi:hypothetical protein